MLNERESKYADYTEFGIVRTIEECVNDLICDIENFIGGNITERQNELLNEILEIHKAERRPKGKWIPQWEKEGNFSSLRMCSECKVEAIIDGWEVEQRTRFCPNCGADMRESEGKNAQG